LDVINKKHTPKTWKYTKIFIDIYFTETECYILINKKLQSEIK